MWKDKVQQTGKEDRKLELKKLKKSVKNTEDDLKGKSGKGYEEPDLQIDSCSRVQSFGSKALTLLLLGYIRILES